MSSIPMATILIATAESDARLRAEQNSAGNAARIAENLRSDCPHDPSSLIASWWFEGYDQGLTGPVITT